MALKTQKGLDVPSGCIQLSEKEALAHQWNFIKSWPSEMEVMFLKFGRHLMAASTLISSFYITNFFKNILYINNTRYLISVIPGTILPGLLSYFSTDPLITNSILLMKQNCPICQQLKFGGVHLYLSLVFPATYGYISFLTFAYYAKSYPIPDINKNARAFWRETFNIFKKGTAHFQMVGLAQTILILFLPYLQSKQFDHVVTKAQKTEYYNEFNS